MLRNKRILLILILAIALFLTPSICNAATIEATQTTTTSTGKTVKWSYELDDNNNIINLVCTNKSEITGTVDIPSTIDDYKVTKLGDENYHGQGAFKGCTGINGVKIPNTITTIGVGAFDGCVGLREVSIPDSVVTIDDRAFYECVGINFTIPNSVTEIGNNAFYGCVKMKLEMPDSVVSIGDNAFEGCTGSKTIKISKNVTTIGEDAFKGCLGITSLVVPDSVTTIGVGAFSNCKALKNVTLSNNLTAIKGATFKDCTSLQSIVIPDSVAIINALYSWGYGAFAGCTNLSKVLIPDSITSIDKLVFEDCSKLTIYGNDGQTSKQYAEENNINFDYIANWDKVVAGDDITPPTIKSLEIAYGSAFKLDSGTGYYLASAGTNISIKVTFEEIIYGKTAPTLTIKCGNGSNIDLTNGTIQGSYIIYTYTIKENDKGIITAVSMTGGDIKDAAGNSAEKYTCTELVTDIWKKYVYANGTKSNPTDQGNNNNDNQTTVTLSSIAITKEPTKNAYSEGESFDKSGMVITATYSDGTTKEITNYSVSPSGALKSTDTEVYITYTENGVTKAVEQKVTVTPKLTINNNSNNDSGNNNSYKDNTEKDTTIKNDNKLPQTGVTVMFLAIIALIVVAIVSKVKCVKYRDI